MIGPQWYVIICESGSTANFKDIHCPVKQAESNSGISVVCHKDVPVVQS